MAEATTEARQPIPPAKRRILQQQYERAAKMMATGNYDYAAEMLTACVIGDPGNPMYAQNYLSNLQKKYNNNKKGGKLAGLKGAGTKTSMKRSSMTKDWLSVLKSGMEFLKRNPWDAGTLLAMGEACEHMGHEESQVAWLKGALDGNITDVDVNRRLARALEAQGDFDAAILCWARVRQGKPGDEEASKGISNCTVKRTIKTAKYEEAESSTDVMADKQAQQDKLGGGLKITAEQQLEKAIKKAPADVNNYLELADLHTRHDRYPEAEQVLLKAMEISGGDLAVRERLEDAKLRKLRDQVLIAEKRHQEEGSEDSGKLHKRYLIELNTVETEYYSSRSERYPNHLGYKFELGLRLQKAGQVTEAIKLLQEARADTNRRAEVHLALGECFQQIKQYKLAMSNYETAIAEMSDRNVESKKKALYRAAKLAVGLKEADAAEKFANELAGIDFAYRDVPDLLEKIRKLREEQD